MARILAISSHVASGHVGLAAIVPALHALGHEVIAVPTVVLSCHYGHAHVGTAPVSAEALRDILGALQANGSLDAIDAVLTGYMPDAACVDVVSSALNRIGEDLPDVLYLCDPILGDDPGGLYVAEDTAVAIRDRLVPFADVLTPNRFELAWLTGEDITDAEDADVTADAIGADLVVVTSVPAEPDQIANVMSGLDDALVFTAPRRAGVPHGTGDLFAALLLGHLLTETTQADAVARASAGVAHVIEASIGLPELSLVANIAAAALITPQTGTAIA